MKYGRTYHYLSPLVRATVRKEKLKQLYLAMCLGTHETNINRYLRGSQRMSSSDVRVLADILGLKPRHMIMCDICEEYENEMVIKRTANTHFIPNCT